LETFITIDVIIVPFLLTLGILLLLFVWGFILKVQL